MYGVEDVYCVYAVSAPLILDNSVYGVYGVYLLVAEEAQRSKGLLLQETGAGEEGLWRGTLKTLKMTQGAVRHRFKDFRN